MKINGFSDALKTNPNKAKQTRSEAEIPTGELLGIHKPGTNQTQPVVSLPALSKPVPSGLVLSAVEVVEGVEVSNQLQTQQSSDVVNYLWRDYFTTRACFCSFGVFRHTWSGSASLPNCVRDCGSATLR